MSRKRVINHGSYSEYTRGCRCPDCFAAARQYRKDIRDDPERYSRHQAHQKKYRSTERGKALTKEHRDRRRSLIRELTISAKSVPCSDCSNEYPYYVMDLDHRPEEKKLFNLASASRDRYTKEVILAEIKKCDVVCSNCHRIRTYNRQQEG